MAAASTRLTTSRSTRASISGGIGRAGAAFSTTVAASGAASSTARFTAASISFWSAITRAPAGGRASAGSISRLTPETITAP
jgi:hypothetical protein